LILIEFRRRFKVRRVWYRQVGVVIWIAGIRDVIYGYNTNII